MTLGTGDISHDCRLPIGADVPMHAQLVEQARATAVREHEQIGMHCLRGAIDIYIQHITAYHSTRCRSTGGGYPLDNIVIQPFQQHLSQSGIFDDIAQGRHRFLLCGQTGYARVAAVGYMNLLDRLNPGRQLLPNRQPFKQ